MVPSNSQIGDSKMSNVRYIVYVSDHSHKEDSIDYEMEFTSIREVVRYTHSLPSMYCCGHVDKLTLIDGEWFSDTIMHF
jgi:hypothetical protein